jgi:uncharacterized protein
MHVHLCHWGPLIDNTNRSMSRRLLDQGADARFAEKESQRTALHYICEPYYETSPGPIQPRSSARYSPTKRAVAAALIRSGANINAAEALLGQIPLVAVSKSCDVTMIQLLLDLEADIDSIGLGSETALVAACRPHPSIPAQDMKNAVEFLLQRGASVQVRNADFESALDVLGTFEQPQLEKTTLDNMLAELVSMLLNRGLSPDAVQDSSESPMLRFFLRDYTTCSKVLVEHGAKPLKPYELRKMIAHAVRSNNADAMRLVLSLDGARRLMATPARLLGALRTGVDRVVEILLDNGAPHTRLSKDGWSCLHYASNRPDLDISFHRKLLQAGADPNTITQNGLTPLKAAIMRGRLPLVELLLEHGADPDLTGSDPCSPMVRASEISRIDILEALLERSKVAPQDRRRHLLALKAGGTQSMPRDAEELPLAITERHEIDIPVEDIGSNMN